jgi:hypothetical protein
MATAEIIATEAPFNAPTNGSTNAKTQIQAAIDATPDRGICILPPVTNGYTINQPLILPRDRKIKFTGGGWGCTLIKQASASTDVIKFASGGVSTDQDRFDDFAEISGFELQLNTELGTTDYSPAFDRCTYEGIPISACGIVFDDPVLPSSADTSRNETWPLTFCTVRDITISVTTKGANHRVGGIYVGGAAYGWKFQRIRGDNMGVMLACMLPGVRRISGKSGSNLTFARAATYANNAQVETCYNTHFGTAPTLITRRQELFTRNPTSGVVGLSLTNGGAVLNPTLGTAPLYVFAVDEHSDVFSPDAITVEDITHYGGHCTWSFPQVEGGRFGRIDAYGQDVMAYALNNVATGTGSRNEAISCLIDLAYYEAPQSNPITAAEDFIKVNMKGGRILHTQIRGTDSAGGRPKVRLDGRGYDANFYLLSNSGQDQPDLIIDGDGIDLRGICHVSATITDNGANNTSTMRRDASGAAFQAVS